MNKEQNNNNPQNQQLNIAGVGNRVFYDHFLQKATKLTFIEKIVLKFKKKLYYRDELELITIVYKKWRGKTYILDSFHNPPKHFNCRCSIHGCNGWCLC